MNQSKHYETRMHSQRWGVILAGGEGKRLLPLTRTITGDERPKQFCAVMGNSTLLDQTRQRVKRVIRPEQTLTVVTKAHSPFYRDLINQVGKSSVLEQPFNRGTAPAIVYSLMRVRELDPNAVVAIFPSDHHFADEDAFAADLETAFQAAEVRSDRIMLLGVVPDYPEAAYGWVEPGAPIGGRLPDSVCHVSCFWEKPSRSSAITLMRAGCLWNTFVLVGKVRTFLTLVERALPQLLKAFASIRSTLSTTQEECAVSAVYGSIRSSSFSDDVLAVFPYDLAVICCTAGWSDLGEPRRVISALERTHKTPVWPATFADELNVGA